MKRHILSALFALLGLTAAGQEFDLDNNTPRYSDETGYGYDFIDSPRQGGTAPYYFSVRVPDGNYRVTVTLGDSKRPTCTTVRAESRRLLASRVELKKGETRKLTFVVNKHSPEIYQTVSDMGVPFANPVRVGQVRLKTRELKKLNWDDRLTLEFNGPAPACTHVSIEPDTTAVTLFLCGNSTVVDQDEEPWASWGQMITCFFPGTEVCIANYAESGETASTFIGANRLAKALSQMKRGDFIFMEFGHNDQKQKGPGMGAYYNYTTALKTFIDEAELRGATPILVTPTQRRSFKDGQLMETHANYPEAMHALAERENIALIDLHEMTRTLFETLGEEGSKRALVHYPAGTYPGQTKAFADNTHFNPYGAMQVAKCIARGLKAQNFPFAQWLQVEDYDPAHPDNPDTFIWDDSPFFDAKKPDGN